MIKKTKSIETLYSLFLNELNFIKSTSEFTLRDARSIAGTGHLIEMAIRKFLREVIGERFKITHGYIYSSTNQKLSRQIDIIITDTLVTNSLKKFDYLHGMEVVPVEAVVGIFEVKKKLTKKALNDASSHLNNIFKNVPLKKDLSEKYLPGGILLEGSIKGGSFSNPIIGIIGLQGPHKILRDYNFQFPIDFIFSFDGFLKAIKEEGKLNLKVFSCRSPKQTIQYIFYHPKESKIRKEKILQGFVGYLLKYLSEVCGRQFDMNDYFENIPT